MCLRRCVREEEEAATRSGKELHRDELRVPALCHVSFLPRGFWFIRF